LPSPSDDIVTHQAQVSAREATRGYWTAVAAFPAGPDSGWISGQNVAAAGGLLP